jgi:hypothetical protein
MAAIWLKIGIPLRAQSQHLVNHFIYLLNKAWLLIWMAYGLSNPNKGAQKR